MIVQILKCEINSARVDVSNSSEYKGVMIDSDIMDKVKLLPYERIVIVSPTGQKYDSYAVPTERGSGKIIISGAIKEQVLSGEKITIMSFCSIPIDQVKYHKPMIICLDDGNNINKKLKEL